MQIHATKHSAPLVFVNSAAPHHKRSGTLFNGGMKTVGEVRRENLGLLRDRYGTWPALNIALGRSARDATLGQIWNRNPDSKTGRPRQMGDRLARAIEQCLELPEGWLDVPHEAPTSAPQGDAVAPPQSGGSRPKIAWHSVIAWETPADLPDNEFALVSRRAVKLAAGNGKLVFEDEELPPLPFRADWLRGRRVTKHANLVIVYAEGDSMEPDIRDGDAVLLDMGQREIVDGQVYAIDYGGHLRVKRLQKRWDGGLIILSDNNEKYPPESLPPDHASHIMVLGRVIWRGGSV
ncbi:S24 family peptidase [Quisquiliibacterium transsilvanicum]